MSLVPLRYTAACPVQKQRRQVMGNEDKPKYLIDGFLEFLHRNRDNRGVMADLRHGASPRTRYRAWPHLAGIGCPLENQKERKILLLIGCGYAVLGGSGSHGNMGDALRGIALGSGSGMDGLTSFEGRFRRLLSCRTAEELCPVLYGIIRAAKQKGIAVNLRQLYWDLKKWDNDDDVKVKWASHYWGQKQETAEVKTEGGAA